MTGPSSRRQVQLIDARVTHRPFVRAEVYRDYPFGELERIEALWAEAREQAAMEGLAAGLALEHAHWDWRNKADSVEAGHHMLVAVECEGEAQGLMALLRTPRPAQLGGMQVVYVDYVEAAPWNLKSSVASPRLLGVGTVLIAEAVRLSRELGLDGRVGLHSLPQAEAFYSRCRMTRVGADPRYYDLTYFEYTKQKAADWLASVGEPP
jgi:GNAT superfamily N-acetyltransferase